ncbi:MAG: penicillin acylase family protein [Candidatus Binatia bacterium]
MEAPKSGLFATVFSALLLPVLNFFDKPSQPRYRGEITLAGLQRAVNVEFDRYAVPHVQAADEQDMFFAQGYLHAQERLWQMEMSRRFLSGRMAELFGDFPLPWRELSGQFRGHKTSDLDFFIRLLGIRQSAVQSVQLLSESDRGRLNAYSQGINRYIESCGKKFPWEFRLLRFAPEPWTAEDSLTIGKGLSFLLSTALYTRLNLMRLAARLEHDPEKLRSLLPTYPIDAPTISRAIIQQATGLTRFTNGILADTDWHGAGHGSNNWVVGPEKAKSGAAMLCNDPHLRMTLPSMFYLMRLAAGEESAGHSFDTWGASIPGLPCIQLGQNRSIAWGITAALCDDVELYSERIHRIERDRYLAGQEWHKFAERRERIVIRGGKAIERIIRSSRHGPIIGDFVGTESSGEVLALSWCATEPSREIHSVYRLNQARDWQEFLTALQHHSAPSLNFLYADRFGNIGYALGGKIPKRSAQPSILPLAGWDECNDWRGYIPFEELPRLYNPPSGFIATANNQIVDSAYPYYLSNFFEPPQRVRRIYQLLQSQEHFTADDMAKLQLDQVSLHAVELIQALSADLRAVADRGGITSHAVAKLLAWDGDCTAASIPAAIFHVFHQHLLANLLRSALGDEVFGAYTEILNQCIVPTDKILRDEKSCWFAQRSRRALVAQSLEDACAELRQSLGTDCERWQWGKLHQLSLNHALSRLAILKPAVCIGPTPVGGDGMTVNFGFYRHSNPYSQSAGAALRYVIDFNDPARSGYVLASGQSGHPGSPHYGDQIETWQSGAKIQLSSHLGDSDDHCLVMKPC